MPDKKREYILVLGCQRSGTTWLASMLGAHPDISMLFEAQKDEIKRLIGTRYSGNKLLLYRDIRFKQRASKFGYIINRLRSIGYKDQRRLFPTSKLSIQDYVDMGAKIIVIDRCRGELINSMINRTGFSGKEALNEWYNAHDVYIKMEIHHFWVDYEQLKETTETIMQKICSYLDIPFYPEMIENGVKYNWLYDWKGSSEKTKDYRL